jgi:hypothetical protein
MQLQDIQNDDGYLFLLKLVENGFDQNTNLDKLFDTVKNVNQSWVSAVTKLVDKIGCMPALNSFIENSPQEWFDYSHDGNGIPIRLQYTAQRRYGFFAIVVSHLYASGLIANDDVVSNVTT